MTSEDESAVMTRRITDKNTLILEGHRCRGRTDTLSTYAALIVLASVTINNEPYVRYR
jgi:hypothetical protein